MKILLEAKNAADPTPGDVITWHSMSATVGQAVLSALLARLPPQALGRVRESYPLQPGGMPGELLVTITLDGEMPSWALEIFAP
jgi:hypothetical protein